MAMGIKPRSEVLETIFSMLTNAFTVDVGGGAFGLRLLWKVRW
jgi:hypothetical protein